MTESFRTDSEGLIPLTDRRWRERWALELSRANQLETALRKAEADLADWHRIALENGERAELAEVDAARAQGQVAHLSEKIRNDWLTFEKDNAEHMRVRAAYFARADKLAEYIQHDLEHTGESVEDEHVRDLILEAGVECRQCDGRGWDTDEEMVGDPGDKFGYRSTLISAECESCHGIGRVLR